MCNYLFVAAAEPLPLLSWNDDRPGVHVDESQEVDRDAVSSWMTKRFIYDVGSHDGCGCPFSSEPNWDDPTDSELRDWAEAREDFRQLAAYLEEAIKIAGEVELYNGWNYWEAPLLRRLISPRDLLGDRFVFRDRELLTVRASSDAVTPPKPALPANLE